MRDPEILRARTLADKDIFYNTAEGLPRAERELAAAATSRVNGCIFCASVHARFAAHHSKRHDDVQRLLDDGIDAAQDAAWRAVIDAAVALAATPLALDRVAPRRAARRGLRRAGGRRRHPLGARSSTGPTGSCSRWASRRSRPAPEAGRPVQSGLIESDGIRRCGHVPTAESRPLVVDGVVTAAHGGRFVTECVAT